MKNNQMEGNQNPQNQKKGKTGSLIVGTILIALILGGAAWWYINQAGYVRTDDAYIDANKLNVSPQMLGRIVHLYANEGDTVYKGELLVQLDTSDFVAQLHRAQTNLKEAELGIQLAQIRMEQAEINYNRAKTQYGEKIIPKAKFDNLKKDYEAAKVQLALSRVKVPVIHSSIKVIQTARSHTRIYSHINGIIAKRWVLAGDVVAPGQAIFSIFQRNHVWVTAMLEETDLHRIALGDTVNIDVDAYPKSKFQGKIIEIGNSTAAQFSLIPPSNASGNFTKVSQRIPIKISIHSVGTKAMKNQPLLPGMSVEIKLKTKSDESRGKS